jgi:hypothetical protein
VRPTSRGDDPPVGWLVDDARLADLASGRH